MEKIENYADTNGRIFATADFALHCINMAQNEGTSELYLKMARETIHKLIKINSDSWDRYRHVNFGISYKA